MGGGGGGVGLGGGSVADPSLPFTSASTSGSESSQCEFSVMKSQKWCILQFTCKSCRPSNHARKSCYSIQPCGNSCRPPPPAVPELPTENTQCWNVVYFGVGMWYVLVGFWRHLQVSQATQIVHRRVAKSLHHVEIRNRVAPPPHRPGQAIIHFQG